MKDAETLILNAFLASLYQQQSPLPQAVNVKFREIVQSLETRILELHDLAINTPTLVDSYRQARQQLSSTAAERGMGLKHLKYWSASDPQNSGRSTEGDNVTPDAQEAIEILEKAIKKNQKKYDESDNPTA